MKTMILAIRGPAVGILVTLVIGALAFAADEPSADAKKSGAAVDWIVLFDGKSLDGWKASEATDAFAYKDGEILANAPGVTKKRSHLFYEAKEPFKNFEFEAEVKTEPGSNSGIYFHTEFQETNWPRKGYEVQVNNSFPPDPRRSGSLYGIVDTKESLKDNEWMKYNIRVEGKHIVIKLNDKTIVDYTEPENQAKYQDRDRKLDKGTFALQSHPDSPPVHYRNLRVRRLP